MAAMIKCDPVIPSLWHPYVGASVALLAVIGVIVPWIRDKKTGPKEKAVWTVLMVALAILELWSIQQSEIQHDRQQAFDRCEQLEQFQSIADGLKSSMASSKGQFDDTMTKMGTVLAKTEKAADAGKEAAGAAKEGVAQIIGEGSFFYVAPQHSYPTTPENQDSFFLMVEKQGKHIVWDSEITMGEGQLDEAFFTKPHPTYKMEPLTATHGSPIPGVVIRPERGKDNWYSFLLLSRGWTGIERLDILFNDDKKEWEFEYRVQRSLPTKDFENAFTLAKDQTWMAIPSVRLVKGKE